MQGWGDRVLGQSQYPRMSSDWAAERIEVGIPTILSGISSPVDMQPKGWKSHRKVVPMSYKTGTTEESKICRFLGTPGGS